MKKIRENRTIKMLFMPNPLKKQEAHELLMRTIHAVREDSQIESVRRKDHEKIA